MGNFLKFQFFRAIESKKLILSIGLIILIAISGFALNSYFFSDDKNPMTGMLSMYNSFTQFFYLVFAYVIISNFTDDAQIGALTLYKYMGYSEFKVVLSKLIYFIIIFVPIVDVIIVISSFAYRIEDLVFVSKLIIILDLSIIQVMLLACVISQFIKKTSYATIMMYGTFICMNIINLGFCGLTNQADSNSLSTYFVQVSCNYLSTHPSTWDTLVVLTNEQLFMYALLVCIVWIIVLFIAVIMKVRKIH